MTVVIGTIADSLGAFTQTIVTPYAGPGRNFEVEKRYASIPSLEYRAVQAPAIAVDVNHDERPIGLVKYLEQGPGGQLYAVCEIDGSTLAAGPWFYSPELRHRDGKDVELRSLSLVESPASVALEPVGAFPGSLRDAACTIVYQDGLKGQLVKRADAYDRCRKRGEALVISGHGGRKTHAVARDDERPYGQMRYRSAEPLGVDSGGRTIEMILAPAEQDAFVPVGGRMVRERFSVGAFAGAEERARQGRVKVNRDHKLERLVGKATSLDPHDPRGLVGELRISRTPLGDETLALAADEVLDASVAFVPRSGGERWEGRDRRRIDRAWLGHVALVAEPAYEGARVLAVRGDGR